MAAVLYGCARSNRLLGLMPQKTQHVHLTRRTIQKGGKIVKAPHEGSGTAGNFHRLPARVAALLCLVAPSRPAAVRSLQFTPCCPSEG